MIGIRQADGSFYEIMGDAQTGRKRLVLSAAKTDQHGVRIDIYRSVDGTLDEADSLGSIALDDPEGLGYQDIEFLVDVDAQGQLEASATLPGQAPRTLAVDLSPYRTVRSDTELLNDESLAGADLDVLSDDFTLDPEPMTLDLPEVDLPDFSDEPLPPEPPRSDAELLGDESLASAELDTLDDFSFEEDVGALEAPAVPLETGATESLAPESFDLDDLDAGFDDPVGIGETSETPADDAEDWEKISLDDMESMEFMDTGDEISPVPASAPTPAAPAARDHDDFSFDDQAPLELGDLDSDLSQLPDLDDVPAADSRDDLDQDFLAPSELTEPGDWDMEDPVYVPVASGKPGKAPKVPKVPKRDRAAQAGNVAEAPRRNIATGGLDKTALFLSLATLSLLVLLILVLLFLNMIKAPQAPVIQPEVMGWKPVATVASVSAVPTTIDLGSADAASFEAGSVLEVPEGLKSATISLRLAPGETLGDAQRRFGTPARSQGNLLFW